MANNTLDFALLEFSGSVIKISGSLENGQYVTASGLYSHAEGQYTTAIGNYSHTEGALTTAIGNYSHTEGLGTIAKGDYQSILGRYNIESNEPYLFLIGGGSSNANRSNLLKISPASSSIEISASVNMSGSFKAKNNIFSINNMTFGTLTSTRNYLSWISPISCSLVGMYAACLGSLSGNGGSVKLRKRLSGSTTYNYHMTASMLPPSFTGQMYSLGSPLTASYAPGDILEYEYSGAASINEMFVQADFTIL